MTKQPRYSAEPDDHTLYTKKFDRFYTQFAGVYDWLVKQLPLWRRWITQVLPYIQGPRVLEVSFGTGYLLTQYADYLEVYGIDYNRRMAAMARRNLALSGKTARIQVANVEALPYHDARFNSIVNTMAFTGYPDAEKALAELCRVLAPGGRLVMLDINYPSNGNWIGEGLARGWVATGDILRDMDELFRQTGLVYTEKEVGGFGSVHLYIATKQHRRQDS